MIGTRTERLENKMMSGNRPNYSIVEIGLNTEKSHLNSSEKLSANTNVHNSRRSNE